MEEVLYFSTFEILIKIQYDQLKNKLSYCSHKSIETNEREAIEIYILKNIAPQTNYFKSLSEFTYLGKSDELELNLNRFRFHGIIRDVLKQKLEIDFKIQELIGHSMSNYYFEKVGEQILKIRKLYETKQGNEFYLNVEKLQKLLVAYNENAETDFKIESIVPDNLFQYYLEQKKIYSAF